MYKHIYQNLLDDFVILLYNKSEDDIMNSKFWNNRVILDLDDAGNSYYSIREVHYDEAGHATATTHTAKAAQASTVEELSHLMIHMMSAFTQPVLDANMFKPNTDVEKSTQQALELLKNHDIQSRN
jgi:hypothetical protein